MGMKEWALSRVWHIIRIGFNCTGATAEHDAFFETSYDGSDPVEKFGGAQLVLQEPDASSFPNGELNTFEAEDIPHGINISAFIYGNFMYSYCFYFVYRRSIG
jgi:glutamine synthetase